MGRATDTLAKRYANGLLDVVVEAKGEKVAETFRQHLHDLCVLTEGASGSFFSNPIFSQKEKAQVLEAVLKKNKTEEMLERFLHLLIQLGHIDRLPEIAAAYMELNRERRNEIQAHIRTAFPLGKPIEKRLGLALEKVTGKKVLLNVQVDKDLIGGVIAEVGGVVYDSSIQSYLMRLQGEA